MIPNEPAHEPNGARRARLVLLAGPSGSGKSHLAARAGLPTVCLDDFYKDGDDPSLPIGELGIVDWDHPKAWDAGRAMRTLVALAVDGAAELPIYDIAKDRRIGTHHLELRPGEVFVAEGIFAAELVGAARELGILADAICLVHRPGVTFWRRLVRDLRESRKAPLTLLRRGLALRAEEPRIVARQISLGADPVHGPDAIARLRRVATAPRRPVTS